jgi:tetratricopeptide (TPR) repeat protein
MVLMGVITLAVLIPTVNDWKDTISVHIVDEELSSLETRTTNMAELAELNFKRIANDMDLMASYGANIYDGNLPISTYYPNFYGVSTVDPSLPPGGLDNGVNKFYSVWFDKDNSNATADQYLDDASIMDNVWRSVIQSNQKYTGLYVGFENGLFRHLPYVNLDHFATMSYTCLLDQQTTTGYDPRCRNWYIEAKAENNDIHFTEPYVDATSGLVLISASKALVQSGTGFIGAFGLDISMQDLETFILAEQILDNGYSYLANSERDLIVYPDLDRETIYKIGDLEFDSQDETNDFNSLFDDAFTSTNTSGRFEYTKAEEQWWVVWGKLNTTDYLVVLTAPHSDIIQNVTDIEDKISTSLAIAIVVLIILLLIIIGFSIYTNRWISKNVTKPITELNNATTRITKGDLDVELGDLDAGSKEIQSIHTNFTNLIQAIRYANKDYLSADLNRAFQNYVQVEKMLSKIKNKRGLGAVWNNMALTLQELNSVENNLEKAEEYFNKAIENAKKMVDEEEVAAAGKSKKSRKGKKGKKGKKSKTDESNIFFKIKLAGRYMNLGLFYAKCGESKSAKKMYRKALELQKETDDKLGEIKTLGNYGTLYLQTGRKEDAFGMFDEAYQVAFQRFGDNNTGKNAEVLQYASMNMGIYYKSEKQYGLAIQFFNYALSIKDTIDTNLKNMCLFHLSEIYDQTGNNGLAEQIRGDLSIAGSGGPKHVIFVLDVSGSMAGSRITTCRQSIISILQDSMDQADSASLLTFSSETQWVFKYKTIAESLDDMLLKVRNNTRPGGGTAFYKAVHKAATHVHEGNEMNNSNQWIVALTDGEDNRSDINSNTVAKFVKKNKINIIIITVGNLKNSAKIKEITESSEMGLHMEASDIDGIKEAFGHAIEYINRGQVNLESL